MDCFLSLCSVAIFAPQRIPSWKPHRSCGNWAPFDSDDFEIDDEITGKLMRMLASVTINGKTTSTEFEHTDELICMVMPDLALGNGASLAQRNDGACWKQKCDF